MLAAASVRTKDKRKVTEWLSRHSSSSKNKTNKEDREERDRVKISNYHKELILDDATRSQLRIESSKNISLRGGQLYQEPEWDRNKDMNNEPYSVPGEAFMGELGSVEMKNRKNYLIDQLQKSSGGRQLADYGDVQFG